MTSLPDIDGLLAPKSVAIDLNPVIAMPRGEGAFALDAVIEVEEPKA